MTYLKRLWRGSPLNKESGFRLLNGNDAAAVNLWGKTFGDKF